MKSCKKFRTSLLLLLLSAFTIVGYSQDTTMRKIRNLEAITAVTYFNFETGKSISASDTTINGWDISFQHTAIDLQAKAAAQIVNAGFDDLTTAPSVGDQHGKAGIPAGSGKGWYSYNMETHVISPIPGRVLILRTAAGKLVKMRIDSYYKEGTDGEPGYYSFRYAFLPSK
jgi:hypothetical protein